MPQAIPICDQERFFRVPGQEQISSGLGLTVVKEIVEAHGGAIEATSRPGKGTRFTFTVKAVAGPGRNLI
ncbi:MAG: sensor histidine kinase [Deltaproteobacteria bacterium]|nr:sensor histidine kinase [Deltaproteobacteria bacterium]